MSDNTNTITDIPSHRERIERLAFEIARRSSPFGGNGLPKQPELEEMIEKHFPDDQSATQSAAAAIQRADEDVERAGRRAGE